MYFFVKLLEFLRISVKKHLRYIVRLQRNNNTLKYYCST